MRNFKFRFNRILNLALGLAMLDGGLVIGIQIVDFLLSYFFLIRTPIAAESKAQAAMAMGIANFAISILGLLNLAAIIYRITGFTRGAKYNLAQCYANGLRNISALLVLSLLAGLTLIAVSLQISKVTITMFPELGSLSTLLIRGVFLLALPYGVLTCATVVVQRKNPIQALISIYNYIRTKNDFLLLAAISTMYSVPDLLHGFIIKILAAKYISLLTAMWFLFCHIVTLVVYIDNFNVEATPTNDNDKPTKVVII